MAGMQDTTLEVHVRTNVGFSAVCAALSATTVRSRKFAGYQHLPPTIGAPIERWTSCAAHIRPIVQYQRTAQAQDTDFVRANVWSGSAYAGRSHERFCWLLDVPARPKLPGESACTQELNFDCIAMSLPSRRN